MKKENKNYKKIIKKYLGLINFINIKYNYFN
jgi:hypothetical protein